MDPAFPNDDVEDLLIRHCIAEGLTAPPPHADVIQLRAKDVSASELLRRALRLREAFAGKLLINDRIDVCVASMADGVHLPARRMEARRIKERFGAALIVGVSCHSLDDLRRAEDEGADYAYLSPIFRSSSKPGYGPSLGLDVLAAGARAVRIPVVALGGVTPYNEQSCIVAGAAGIAGISYFEQDQG